MEHYRNNGRKYFLLLNIGNNKAAMKIIPYLYRTVLKKISKMYSTVFNAYGLDTGECAKM